MSIISRYLGTSFLKTWALALVGFWVLYSAIDFLEKIGDFMAKDIGWQTVGLYFLAQTPKILVLMSPVATLVGVLITLTLLARASEIVAFKAGGVSLYRLSAPLLVLGLGICLLMFTLSDLLAPQATSLANSIWQGQVRGRLNTSTEVYDIWRKGVLNVQHFGSYNETDHSARDLTLVFVDEDMNLSRRLEAAGGRFVDGRLVLFEVMEKLYAPHGAQGARTFVRNIHPTLTLEGWPVPPPGFGRTDHNSEELSVAQLWRTIDRLTAEGLGPLRQRVDLQFKFSFALLSLIMVVVGLPIGFWREKGGGIALGLAVGLILSFVYLIMMELARSLGYSGLLPPVIAAWLPNLIFLLFGAYLFSYVRQ